MLSNKKKSMIINRDNKGINMDKKFLKSSVTYCSLSDLEKKELSQENITENNLLYYACFNNDEKVFKFLANQINYDTTKIDAIGYLQNTIKNKNYNLFVSLKKDLEKKNDLNIFFNSMLNSFMELKENPDNNELKIFQELYNLRNHDFVSISYNNSMNLWLSLCLKNRLDLLEFIVENEKDKIKAENLMFLIESEHYKLFKNISNAIPVEEFERRIPLKAGYNVLHTLLLNMESQYLSTREINTESMELFKFLVRKNINLEIKTNSGKNYFNMTLPKNLLEHVKSEIEKEEISNIIIDIKENVIKKRI